jgi:hypothetical protein
MPVYIPCEKCQKRLKIPENVLGKSIKCPACGSVFKADPEKATPAEAKPAPAPAAPPPHPVPVAHEGEEEPVAARAAKKVVPLDEDEDAPRPAKKAVTLDDDEGEEDVRPAKKKAVVEEEEDVEEVRPAKKAVVLDDEDEEAPARPAKKKAAGEDEGEEARPAKKKAAVAEDEDEKPARAKKKRPAEEDEAGEDEGADKPKKGKRRTPWYVMLPLLLLSLSAVGLFWLWSLGPAEVGMDRTMGIDIGMAPWIGIGLAGGVALICLIVSLLSARAWLRLLLVFLLILLSYGVSLGLMAWSNSQQPSGRRKVQAPAPLVRAVLDGAAPTTAA